MSYFLFKRVLTLLATLLATSVIVFAVLEVLPGNAAQVLMGADADPEAVKALAIKLGLDQPVLTRYLNWIECIGFGNHDEFPYRKTGTHNVGLTPHDRVTELDCLELFVP